jgi:hypothetical protein
MTSDLTGTNGPAPKPRAKGPWFSRLAIKILTAVVAVLIYWLLGFIVKDIGNVAGPSYQEIEERHLDQKLVQREEVLDSELRTIDRLINKQNEKQRLLSQSSQGLQKTMGQLLELQKLSIEKGVNLSAEQSAAFNDSLNVFLSNQDRFQKINEIVAAHVDKKQELEDEQNLIQTQMEEQRLPALKEYQELRERHSSRLALFKLFVLIPLFLVGVWLVLKKRGNIYFPLIIAFAGATSLKILMVMHEHFPDRYFKYVLILIALVAAARLLVYFIRSIIAPKRDRLIRHYREAYENFLCPVCEYPIRRGPMKFLYWNRRSLKKLRLPASSEGGDADNEHYTCPACSTELFSECPSCNSTRPTLLPFCNHCGASDEKNAK